MAIEKRYTVLVAIFLTSFMTIQVHAQVDLFNALSGTYEVGFRYKEIDNVSKQKSRKIRIYQWYPARSTDAKKMKLADYLTQNERDPSDLANVLSTKIGGEENLFPTDSLEMLLDLSTLARPNAPAVDEKFPVIMWSGRNETVEYQWLISEYLASNGYVVAYTEDVPTGPYPWQLPSPKEKESGLDQQISNMTGALAHLWLQKNVDLRKSGIISWSYAGESAILAQQGNPVIRAVVGLSSLGFSRGVFLGNELKDRIDLEKLKVPYLMLFEKVAPNGTERAVPDIFPSMHPASRYVSFPELAHGSFNTLEGMIPGTLGTNKVHGWSRGGKEAKVGYETICKVTLLFLDSILKDKENFDSAIRKIKTEVPDDFMTVSSPMD